ncbi:transcriptional regulator [Caulobacter radicis]|uniref:GntR family transcriptional regulator n=1 Tax=Caulobacter radicis TaxID=2172650 RepID=UPI000D56E488|nr:GntR family transcriptional regulator [Caulobacter radicis]PVM84500.1 transcriptional regulator [Caulobacter radicis]
MTKPNRSARTRSANAVVVEPADSGRRLGDLAYRRILEGLFDRRVPAGSFISQSELAGLLDLPIQPLRDALRVLETEGILKIHARSGIEFLKADLELARSTYQFRSIIERSAARAYAETADSADIAALIEAHRELLERVNEEGASEGVKVQMERLEQEFHGSMIAALRNPMIETTARRLKNYVALIRLDLTATAPRVVRTIREHLDVLEACQDRDPVAAEAALALHFQAALQRILGMV